MLDAITTEVCESIERGVLTVCPGSRYQGKNGL